jgi:hypothetical protein
MRLRFGSAALMAAILHEEQSDQETVIHTLHRRKNLHLAR